MGVSGVLDFVDSLESKRMETKPTNNIRNFRETVSKKVIDIHNL